MTSPIYYNNNLAQFVFKPHSKQNTLNSPNQDTFYSNFVMNHIQDQHQYNNKINQYFNKNNDLIFKLQAEDSALRREYSRHANSQQEKHTFIVKTMDEQKRQQEVIVNFMEKQTNFNERSKKQTADHKEQIEVLQQLVKNQENFHFSISENFVQVRQQFENIMEKLSKQGEFQRELTNHLDVKQKEENGVASSVKEQSEILYNVITNLKEHKEQYDILFDYIKNQDKFNHKLFEYLCEKFERIDDGKNSSTVIS